MWLTRDKIHGYRLWFIKPVFNERQVYCHQGILSVEPPHPISLDYFDEPNENRVIEDIFIKLDGGEMKIGEMIKVNLVEDDLCGGEFEKY